MILTYGFRSWWGSTVATLLVAVGFAWRRFAHFQPEGHLGVKDPYAARTLTVSRLAADLEQQPARLDWDEYGKSQPEPDRSQDWQRMIMAARRFAGAESDVVEAIARCERE